jgi:hypothetical protein
MSDKRIRIPLRRVNDTLRVAIPLAFKRLHDLHEGDEAVWIEEDNSVRLEFVRVTVNKTEELVVGTAA